MPEPAATTPPSPGSGKPSGGGALKHYAGLALLLIVLAGIAFWGLRTCQAMLNEQVAGVRDMFSQTFRMTPEIRVNQTVVYTQTSPIQEYAVVRKEELVEMTLKESMQIMSTNIPMTSKELHLRAIYRIKAGFDLSKPFVVNIDQATGKITAQMPPAEILSLEKVSPLTIKEEAGWLTSITPQEREDLINKLDAVARQAAQDSGLIEEANEQAIQSLQELAARNGQDLTVELKQQN